MARSLRVQAAATTRALELQVEPLLVPGRPTTVLFQDERVFVGADRGYRVTPVLVEIENVGNGVAQVHEVVGTQSGTKALNSQCHPIAVRGGGVATVELWFEATHAAIAGTGFSVVVNYEGGDGIERSLPFRCHKVYMGGGPVDPDLEKWVISLDTPRTTSA